jgi:hypothetical protein
MGGIVASSPELASTVQRFQTGGDVTGLPPELLSNPSVQRLAARQGLSPAEYLMALSPAEYLMGMVPSFEPAPMDDFAMEFGDAGTGFPMPPPTPAEVVGLDMQTATPPVGSSRRSPGPRPERDTAATQYLRELTNLGDQPPTGRRRQEESITEAEELLEQDTGTPLEIPEDPAELLPPPDPLASSAAEAPERTADPMSDAADTTADELRDMFGVGRPDRAPRNRRERVEQELDLIKEVFGHRNKDEARERAMNLAMIGLAIAAGQSPNALTNIAQGALAGTQAMQRSQAAEREREDALRMQAYESVLGEEREERQFGRQMQLESFKAGLRAEGETSAFTKPTHPMNQWFTTRNQLDQQARDPSSALWEEVQALPEAERNAYLDNLALDRIVSGAGQGSPEVQELAESVRSGRAGQAFASSAGNLTPDQNATLDAARRTLQRNPGARAEIESRLQAVGIDPSLL